jgi:hypothetical protein
VPKPAYIVMIWPISGGRTWAQPVVVLCGTLGFSLEDVHRATARLQRNLPSANTFAHAN